MTAKPFSGMRNKIKIGFLGFSNNISVAGLLISKK
jgi:hypothetical protein